MRKSEIQQKQRRRTNKLSQKIDPHKLEIEEAKATARNMREIHDRLKAEGKLYRLNITNGVMIGTLPVLEAYIQQHKLDATPTPLTT